MGLRVSDHDERNFFCMEIRGFGPNFHVDPDGDPGNQVQINNELNYFWSIDPVTHGVVIDGFDSNN